jgi:hypothetical protein
MRIQIVGDRSCYFPQYKNVINCGITITNGAKEKGKDCSKTKNIEIGTFSIKELNKDCKQCE